MALTAWSWTAAARTWRLALHLPGLGGISERRQLRQPLSLCLEGASGALEPPPSPCYC